MKKTTITMLCLAACFAAADTKITWLADVTADRAETVTGVQSGQVASAASHINRTDNPHSVTAAQIGALTNETDSLVLSVLATNRTTVVFNPTNRNEFTDGARRVWRINTVTNTFTGWSVIIETPISICGEIIQPSTNQWPGIPYPLWTNSALSYTQFITNYPAGSTQPMVIWYYYRTGSASPHEVHFSSPAEESSASWYSNYQSASATNSVRVLFGRDDLSPTWSDPVYMVYGTNTTVSVVTSQVATVAWQSDLADIATTQHVAEAIAAIPLEDLTGYQSAAYWPPDATASSWFTFTTNSGAITITGYNIAGGTDVVIPDYINGWPVTAIGANAFMGSGVTSIGGAGNVVTVGASAFGSCSSLTSVLLPQAKTVGAYAFYMCTSLTSVYLPQAQTVGDYAFASCNWLTSLYFNGNAPTIGAKIFLSIVPNRVKNYVTNPQATGWGATLGGMPVVRLPLYADAIYQAGELVATEAHVAQAIAAIPEPDLSSRVAVQSGHATDLAVSGWLALPQSQPTNLIMRLVSSNDVIIAIGVIQ